jgi:acylphosphatase
MTVETDKQIRAVVYGRVQGVSFRHYTQLEARRYHLVGWVANHPEGTVHLVAEGPESALQQFLIFLHQGPSMALVERVVVSWQPAQHQFTQFSVRWL